MSEYVTLYRAKKTLRAERFVARATTRERARASPRTRARDETLANSREEFLFSPSSANEHGRRRRSRVPADADADADGDQVVATPTTKDHASIRRARRRGRARGGDARE